MASTRIVLVQRTELDYSYFAGLLDGEGWIGAVKNSSGAMHPRIQIGMTNLGVLEWCSSMFGGSIHVMKSRLAKRDAWKWNMATNGIKFHIPYVIPYMKVKRQQAEIAVDWALNHCGIAGTKTPPELIVKQEELWTSLKALKQSIL